MVRAKCSTTFVGDVVCSAVGRMRRYAKLSEVPVVACIARALGTSTAKVVAMLHARFEAVSREGEGEVDECSFTGARCRLNSLIGSCGSWPSPCPVRGAPAADRPAKFTSAPDRSLQKFCSLTRNIQSFTSLRISRVAVQLSSELHRHNGCDWITGLLHRLRQPARAEHGAQSIHCVRCLWRSE